MAAARAWAAGTLFAETRAQHEPEAIADARRWNASDAELDGLRLLLGHGPAAIAVWPVNVASVAAFCTAGTQWRSGLDRVGGVLRRVWIGLDYAGAKVSIEASGITITPEIWAGVRIMEHAALAALNGEVVH